MTVLLQTGTFPPFCIQRHHYTEHTYNLIRHTSLLQKNVPWDLNQTDIKTSAFSLPCSDHDLRLIHKPLSLGDKAKALSVTYEQLFILFKGINMLNI